ncbi:MAG: family 43 glycosylhydrolase [Oscillospiraceae bacterium]|nr:family 43 glycosylhydrolase [Oscillospiraceae bacterium]
MKKFISILLVFASIFCCLRFTVNAEETEFTVKTDEIRIRDPFILVANDLYYMYGTAVVKENGYGCYISRDLEKWAGPYTVFAPSPEFEGIKDFWAPECHYYNGSYYLFASYFSSATEHRGVSVFRADDPLGPFEEISNGHITADDIDAIDGTLYVDENGKPWMIYCHEWTSMPDEIGAMEAAPLSDDLTHFTDDPTLLFRANAPVWTTKGITDGPFMYKTKYGKLIMIWSNKNNRGYCVGIAKSKDGTPNGKWSQQVTLLYSKSKTETYDGGHGMIFRTLDGRLMMCIHSPNSRSEDVFETAKFIEVYDTGYSLIPASKSKLYIKIIDLVNNIRHYFETR